ncbi:MAG: bile acid:sodium symporter, partial [Cyclobacteriaceae bacterium]|nr:bile acid:sodium symporter [Cyclobacteriaceae bacterium]
LVFLKSDLVHILREIKNYKLMLYLVCAYMIIIPVLFFFAIDLFNHKLAIGILLLTAMPAAVSLPALADIVKGNTALSTSITIVTSIIAPFTIPILFGLLNFDNLAINPWQIFKDLSIIIFIPMLLSQVIRKFFTKTIHKTKHLFTSINILLLSIMVYIVMGSIRDVVIVDSLDIIMQVVFLYFIFSLLHVIGYLMGYKQNNQNKITISIGAAYMNNSMAIVLAAKYFDPYILVLMVLSELPWTTMLAPFRKIISLRKINDS